MLAFIQDAKRFVLYNRSIIEEAPLQIYSSALIFTPQESIVRSQFEKQVPSWIKKLPAVSKRWSQLLQTFEGHTIPVRQIAFAPDGKLLASACDETIRLWAPATGACIQTLASSCDIGSLAFTADARMLSSHYVYLPHTHTEAMVGFTVKAWDIAAGTSTLLSFHDHEYQSHQDDRAFEVWLGPRISALSPDGKSLAVTDGDNSIDSHRRDPDILRLWDMKKGTVSKTLIGHSSHIKHVEFSPDSKWIVSSTEDDTLRLWDMMTGACSRTIAGSTRRTPERIAVSENGRLISSASIFDAIYVWDTAARDHPRTLNADCGRGSSGTRLAISPDGNLVAASLSLDRQRAIRIWDTATGTLHQTLEAGFSVITAISFSPDWKQLASGSQDGTLRLWNAARANAQETPDQETPDLRISKDRFDTVETETTWTDGKLMALVREDKTIELWDISTGDLLRALEGHCGFIRAVAFSPAGQLLVSASDEVSKVWSLKRDASLHPVARNLVGARRITFSPDGKVAASASYKHNTSAFKLLERETGVALPRDLCYISAMAFSLDGKLVALALHDNTIELWDAAQLTVIRTLQGHSVTTEALAFSPDSTLLASAPKCDQSRIIQLWDPATGSALHALEGHSKSIQAIAFSPDSKTLASISNDETARLWDTVTGHQVRVLELKEKLATSVATHVACSPDGSLLAPYKDCSPIGLWDVATGVALHTQDEHNKLRALAFSPDGMLVASASADIVKIWTIDTGITKQSFPGDGRRISNMIFSPDSRLLASVSRFDTNTVRLWDVSTGAMAHTLRQHNDHIINIAFSPDGKLMASTSHDKTARLWNPATGVMVHAFENHSPAVRCLAFSPDSKAIALHWGDTLVTRDTATGEVLEAFYRLHHVSTVSFSPNGKLMALSSFGAATIWLWEAATGATLHVFDHSFGEHSFAHGCALAVSPDRCSQAMAWGSMSTGAINILNGNRGTLSILKGHSDEVDALAFSSDGKILLSASRDETIRLWDTTTYTIMHVLEGHSESVTIATFSQDGRLIASSSPDGTIRIWETATGASIQAIDIDADITRLAFSPQGPHLETDRGVVAMKSTVHPRNASFDSPNRACRVFVKGNWVTWDMENMLWIPTEYRKVCVSNEKNCLACDSSLWANIVC